MRRSISQTRKKYLQATWGNCWVESKQTVKRLFNDIYIFAEDNILLSMTYWKKELFTTYCVIHFNDMIKDIVICNKAILHFWWKFQRYILVSFFLNIVKIEKFAQTIYTISWHCKNNSYKSWKINCKNEILQIVTRKVVTK